MSINFFVFSELFKNTANSKVVSYGEVRAMMLEFQQAMLESYKEIALNHSINRPQSSSHEPTPGTSGLNTAKTKRYNPMSDDDSDIEGDLGQYGSDVDYE